MAISYIQQAPTGLGACIILLSTLLDAKEQVHLTTDYPNIFFDLKRIFNISDDRLIILEDPLVSRNILEETKLADVSKFYSPYLTSNEITLFGQKFNTRKTNTKPCIAICSVNNSESLKEEYTNIPPENRYYPKSFWLRIADFVLSAGYDVITINKLEISLEEKTFILNELCDAVITYEGGIAHLAHCLNIPTIIFPWKYEAWGELLNTKALHRIHWIHRDKKTFIFDQAEDIFKYSGDNLRNLINTLKHDQGNNFYLNDNCIIDPETLMLSNPDNATCEGPYFTKFEKDFIKTYILKDIQ